MPRTPDYFADKTIVITGAGSGIGRATALIFGREGANVLCADIDGGAAQMRVTRSRQHLNHVVTHLEDGNVEGAAAEIVDCNGLVRLLVQPVGERRGSRLIDDALHFESSDLAGVLGRLTLAIVEVSRHSDDSLGDVLSQIILSGALELKQDLR